MGVSMDYQRHLKVLIVEDNSDHQYILLEQVARLGGIPTISPTLQETFKELKIAASLHIPFDLIILDLGLPDMQKDDPYSVIKAVRTHVAYQHKDVVILLNTATPEQFKAGAYQAAEYRHIYTTHSPKIVTDQELVALLRVIST